MRLGVVPALTIVVAASAAFRVAAAWLRATPTYLPDEYMYSELARSIAETGRPLIRGVEASFPALLQPVVTAPLWLVGDVETAFRLVQLTAAIAMSLAAPVAYLLARRVGVPRGTAVGVAVLAVTVPDLVYTGWILAEPFAYPLVVAAAGAAVAALAAPTRRSQLAFVALAALSTFARTQFAVLPLCFLLALVVVGLRERRLRPALREQALPLALFAVGGVLAAVVGGRSLAGVYSAPWGDDGVPLASLASSLAPDLLVLAYTAGWVVVPGAVLGLVLAISRPRSRAELAFGAVTVVLAGALLLQAGLFGEFNFVQERYVFYVVPLLAISFGLYASRAWPHRRVHALLVGVLFLLSARFPLAQFYSADAKEHSPTLIGASRLEVVFGSPAAGSAVIAGAAAILCAAALLASLRPRHGTPFAIAAAAVVGVAAWAGAVEWDLKNSVNVAAGQLPADRSFVDSADVGPVSVLLGVGAQRINSIHAFWNRSIERVLLLPEAGPIDPFTNERVKIADDGTLSVAGSPVRGALLVDEFATTIRLHGALRVTTAAFDTLWRTRGRVQLSLMMFGRYYDGWLASQGEIDLYPRDASVPLAGTLALELRVPDELGTTSLRVDLPDGGHRTFELRAGRTVTVSVPVCARGRWHATFRSERATFLDGRIVSASVEVPRYTPDPGACSSAV